MLADAFAGWLNHLSERGFDESFLCLLRGNGFVDIHFRHGPFEFGKDFIAKRSENGTVVQYAFQSKAGDIGGSDWSAIYSQLEELTSGRLAPAGFDSALPRRSVLVTTGRLVGKAPVSAQDFAGRVRDRGDGEFVVWERDNLIEAAEGGTRFPGLPSPALAQILAHIDVGESSDRSLEEQLARLVDGGQNSAAIYRALLDNWTCGARLAESGRPLQQMTAALNAIRIAAARAHHDPDEARELIRISFRSYVDQGRSCFASLLEKPADKAVWLAWCSSLCGHIVEYPLLCTRVLEFLGLSALWSAADGEQDACGGFLDLIEILLTHQPGVRHPISDRCAPSFAPALLSLHLHGRSGVIATFLRETAKWVLDRYEASDAGLAGPYSTPAEEVRTLLGPPFESVTLQPRRESFLAAALADLAYYVSVDTYADIVNDLKAVGIVPVSLHPADSAEAYIVGLNGTTKALLNVNYPEVANSTPLPHHLLQPTPRVPEQIGGPAVMLALACLTRDRLFSDCYPRQAQGRFGSRTPV